MVWSSTCIVMSSSPRIALCLLMSTSSGACTAKTLCWPAVITAKQIIVKKYRTVVIIISKSRFGSISIDRISTGSSFGTFCSLRSKLNSDDHNTLHAFYVIAPLIRVTWATKCSTAPSRLVRTWQESHYDILALLVISRTVSYSTGIIRCMESNIE